MNRSQLNPIVRSLFFPVFLLVSLLSVGCSSSGTGDEGQRPQYEPIREAIPLPREPASAFGLEEFVGEPMVDNPLEPYVVPENPFLDNTGSARIHNDGYNSGTYNRPGLQGPNVEVLTTWIVENEIGVSATLAFDPQGFVFGSAIVSGTEVRLIMLDPNTMAILAEQSLGSRPLIVGSAAGGYFSFDQEQRIVIGNGEQRIERWRVDVVDNRPRFVLDAGRDLTDFFGDPAILLQDTVIDWEGRVWFMTDTGVVGYIRFEDDTVVTTDLGEPLQNSMAVDETGVYLVTFEALYKMAVNEAGEVEVAWRAPYEAGSDAGGGLTIGSGTTPTLLGTEDDLVSICDNADGRINLLVHDRTTGAEVCKVPLFGPDASATENSVTAYFDDIVVANSAGFTNPFEPARDIETGMERWQVRADRSGCDIVWNNEAMEADSTQLSIDSGVLYGYGTDRSIEDEDVFYVFAIDWRTGDEIFRSYAGNGKPFDTITGQPHIHPDGRIFMSGFDGIIQLRDAQN